MEKLINNTVRHRKDNSDYATFLKGGYLYLPGEVQREIKRHGLFIATDIFLDLMGKRIVIEPNNDGEYMLSANKPTGYRLCLYSVRDYIHPGRHDVTYAEGPEGQFRIVVAL